MALSVAGALSTVAGALSTAAGALCTDTLSIGAFSGVSGRAFLSDECVVCGCVYVVRRTWLLLSPLTQSTCRAPAW